MSMRCVLVALLLAACKHADVVEDAGVDAAVMDASGVVIDAATPPDLFDAGASGDAAMPSVGACTSDVPTPKMTAPVVDVTSFGAKGDGKTDDTKAIQSAIDSMTSGGTLVFAPGTYLYGEAPDAGSAPILHVRQANVALWGYGGAELRSENPNAQEIELASPNTSIYGFLITAPQFERLSAPNNHRIVLLSSGHQIIDNHIDGGAAAGIFSQGGSNFIIARNIVQNTEADSIHMTQGTTPSHDGRVLQNTVRAPGPYWGDDEVAIIGYLGNGDTPDSMTNANYNFLIECNDLEDAGWGNGVDVGGGKQVTIRKNIIAGIYHAGGIKLGTEASFPTYSTMNVLVQDNAISHIETTGTTKDGTRTSFGAFEIAARQDQSSVRQVLASNNTVDDTLALGVRFEGILCDLGFQNTTMTNVGGGAFGTQGTPTLPMGCTIACAGNTADGVAATNALCTTTKMPTDVTGSTFMN